MPIDLTTLSDEQLEAYRSLLAQRLTEKKITAANPNLHLDVQPPEDKGFLSTLGGDFVSGIKGVVTHPIDTTKNLAASQHEQFQKGRESFGQGNYIPGIAQTMAGAIPYSGPLASQAGEEFGSGQYGQGSAHALEALLPFSKSIPGVDPIARATGSAIKAGAPGMLKGAAGIAAGEMLGRIPGMKWPARIAADYPAGKNITGALRDSAKAFRESLSPSSPVPSFKGPVESPIKPKVLTLSQLQDAVKSGGMTHEEFNSRLLKSGYSPEDAKTISDNLVDVMKRVNPPSLGQTQKIASFSTMKNTVKAGDREINWFKDRLKQQGYSEEDIELESNQLQREIQAAKEAEENAGKTEDKGKKKLDVKPPKAKKLEVEPPRSNLPPGHEAFLETEPPYKPPITPQQIEEAQSTDRAAKETTLARHFIKNKVDLDNIPRTSEYLRAISNEAGLKRVASLRTLEGAIKRSREILTLGQGN